jgi:hypothetical protein
MKPASKILTEKRLREKFSLFEKLCLPSLIHQNFKNNLTIIIRITNNLPLKWKNRLYALTNRYKFIVIQEFDAIKGSYSDSLRMIHLESFIKNDTQLVATTRLDDDDALATNFVSTVRRYISPTYVNKIISFPRGYELDSRNKRYIISNRKLIALGLTLIQKKDDYDRFPSGAYSGNHTKWRRKTKCYFVNNIMYIRSRNNANDSGIGKTKLFGGNNNIKTLKRQFKGIKI